MLKYLEDPYDFEEGVQLFNHFYSNNNLLISLNKGYTISGEDKMIMLLKKVVPGEETELETIDEVEAFGLDFNLETESVALFNPEEAEPILRELKMEKSRLFSQSAAAHLELARLKLSEKERYLLAKLIIEHFERIDEIWLTIDYYAAHGVLPNKYRFATDYEKALENRQRITNLRTYISKLKKEIPIVKSTAKKQSKTERLNAFEFELNRLLDGN